MKHIHSLNFLYSMNSVRCVANFECNHAESVEGALRKYLPDRLEVVQEPDVKNVPITSYKIRVSDELLCVITDLAQGTLFLDHFRGSEAEFAMFQEGCFKGLGIGNIHDGVNLHIYSPHGSVIAKKKEK